GIQFDRPGTRITSRSTRHSAAKNGQTWRLGSSKGVLAMLVGTKSSGGGGGGTAPVWVHITITQPLWIGAMPYCFPSWHASGAKTSRMASESTNVPSTIIANAKTSSTITGELAAEVTQDTARSLNCR